MDALRGLGAVAAERHVRLVIGIIPDGDQLGVDAPDLVPQERLHAMCTELALDCLDLYAAFAAAGGVLHADTMHPNVAGQRVVARALADHLLVAPR